MCDLVGALARQGGGDPALADVLLVSLDVDRARSEATVVEVEWGAQVPGLQLKLRLH
jgi:hypothetical protein